MSSNVTLAGAPHFVFLENTDTWDQISPFSWKTAFVAIRQAPWNEKILTVIRQVEWFQRDRQNSLRIRNMKEWKGTILAVAQKLDPTKPPLTVFDFTNPYRFIRCDEQHEDQMLSPVDPPLDGRVSVVARQGFPRFENQLNDQADDQRHLFTGIGNRGQVALNVAMTFVDKYKKKYNRDPQVQVITLDTKFRHDEDYQRASCKRLLGDNNILRFETSSFSDTGDQYPVGKIIKIAENRIWQYRKPLTVALFALTAMVSYWFAIPLLVFMGYQLTQISWPSKEAFSNALR